MGSSLVPVVADWSSTPMGSHPLRPPGQRRAPRQLVVRRTGSGIGLLHLLHKLDLPAVPDCIDGSVRKLPAVHLVPPLTYAQILDLEAPQKAESRQGGFPLQTSSTPCFEHWQRALP
ncbi:hypothetical protein AK812_SmicGene9269 [Symbiodinium microadriaticum]|uniref:Uncharacterized protein n=1 Tax=Symbiodinium microadriaticum TaxID=2951 RepID=A0A1Q9EJ23_SYMMI|nr:hypothetical protein AK812_SmicGene9269 [Symbiodinium microadriaticum]